MYQGESTGSRLLRSTGALPASSQRRACWLKVKSIENPTICPRSFTLLQHGATVIKASAGYVPRSAPSPWTIRSVNGTVRHYRVDRYLPVVINAGNNIGTNTSCGRPQLV